MAEDQLELNRLRPAAVVDIQNAAAGGSVFIVEQELGVVHSGQDVEFVILEGDVFILGTLLEKLLEAEALLLFLPLQTAGAVLRHAAVGAPFGIQDGKQTPDFIEFGVFGGDQFAEPDRGFVFADFVEDDRQAVADPQVIGISLQPGDQRLFGLGELIQLIGCVGKSNDLSAADLNHKASPRSD